MTSLTLTCEGCGLTYTIISNDELSNYFLKNYGHIDKATGRIFEERCKLCEGTMKATN